MTEAETERAAVVAWLRAEAEIARGFAALIQSTGSLVKADAVSTAEVMEWTARKIERRSHLGEHLSNEAKGG